MNPNQSEHRLISSEFSNRLNPNETEFGLTRIHSDVNFGSDSLELIRIDMD